MTDPKNQGRWLKKRDGDGEAYQYTDVLAEREDMIECDPPTFPKVAKPEKSKIVPAKNDSDDRLDPGCVAGKDGNASEQRVINEQTEEGPARSSRQTCSAQDSTTPR